MLFNVHMCAVLLYLLCKMSVFTCISFVWWCKSHIIYCNNFLNVLFFTVTLYWMCRYFCIWLFNLQRYTVVLFNVNCCIVAPFDIHSFSLTQFKVQFFTMMRHLTCKCEGLHLQCYLICTASLYCYFIMMIFTLGA